MKTKAFFMFVAVLFMSIIAVAQPTKVQTVPWGNTITKLKILVNTNPELKQDLQHLLKNATSKEWNGKNLNDFYGFFAGWLTFNEIPNTAQLYSLAIYDLFAEKNGREVLGKEPMLDWLREFMIARGMYLDSKLSTSGLGFWTSDPNIHILDYVIPLGGFKSFNDFFTRQIRRSVRPVDQTPNGITMPADGYVWLASSNIDKNQTFRLKNDNLDIATLLGGDPLYTKFIGGSAVIVYLRATDYHHFWSPVTGQIVAENQLAGFYVADGSPTAAMDHRRAYFIIKTPHMGYVAMGIIGMYDISSINLIKNVGDNVKVGDELGHFAYGGSEIILLFQKGQVTLNVPTQPNTTKKVGELIGKAANPDIS